MLPHIIIFHCAPCCHIPFCPDLPHPPVHWLTPSRMRKSSFFVFSLHVVRATRKSSGQPRSRVEARDALCFPCTRCFTAAYRGRAPSHTNTRLGRNCREWNSGGYNTDRECKLQLFSDTTEWARDGAVGREKDAADFVCRSSVAYIVPGLYSLLARVCCAHSNPLPAGIGLWEAALNAVHSAHERIRWNGTRDEQKPGKSVLSLERNRRAHSAAISVSNYTAGSAHGFFFLHSVWRMVFTKNKRIFFVEPFCELCAQKIEEYKV